MGKEAPAVYEPKQEVDVSRVIEIFKDFREKTLAEAERTYLRQLVSATTWNIKPELSDFLEDMCRDLDAARFAKTACIPFGLLRIFASL